MKKLSPERQVEYIVQKTDEPKDQMLYEDIGHGNYMVMFETKTKFSKVVQDDPNGI